MLGEAELTSLRVPLLILGPPDIASLLQRPRLEY